MLKNKKRTEATPTVLLLFLARCKGYSRLRRLACSATAAAQQYPPHTSRLKTVHQTVFSTPLTLSGFESLENKKRTEATPAVLLLFLARCKGYSRLRRLACSATAAAQQYPPHTSRLKTVHQTVFSTPLTLSGFESLENKKRTEATPAVLLLFLARCKGFEPLTFWFVAWAGIFYRPLYFVIIS